MQLDIHGGGVHLTPMLGRHIERRLHAVWSRSGAWETAWDLYGPRLEPSRRKLEIRWWVHLHHLELMKSYGRSVARSITKSEATETARATAHLVSGFVTKWGERSHSM